MQFLHCLNRLLFVTGDSAGKLGRVRDQRSRAAAPVIVAMSRKRL